MTTSSFEKDTETNIDPRTIRIEPLTLHRIWEIDSDRLEAGTLKKRLETRDELANLLVKAAPEERPTLTVTREQAEAMKGFLGKIYELIRWLPGNTTTAGYSYNAKRNKLMELFYAIRTTGEELIGDGFPPEFIEANRVVAEENFAEGVKRLSEERVPVTDFDLQPGIIALLEPETRREQADRSWVKQPCEFPLKIVGA